jgi:hypothetical protein
MLMGRVSNILDVLCGQYVRFSTTKIFLLTVHKLHPSSCPLWGWKSLIWACVAMTSDIVMCKSQWLRRYSFERRCLLVVSVSFLETS